MSGLRVRPLRVMGAALAALVIVGWALAVYGPGRRAVNRMSHCLAETPGAGA